MTTQFEVTIRHDLTGAQYIEFINYAFVVGKKGIFVIRDDLPQVESVNVLMLSLGPYLVSVDKVSEWSGTKLHGGALATLYTFVTAETARPILLQCTDHLYGWTQPSLPEDLSFLDGNNVTFIESTIHEEYLLFRLDDLRCQLIREKFSVLWRTLIGAEPNLGTAGRWTAGA
jgi:hypothetical protein